MEPDSTTFDTCSDKSSVDDIYLPFTTCPGNIKFYKEIVMNSDGRSQEVQIIQRLQKLGLLASSVKCPTGQSGCNVVCKQTRVIDRLQWVCEGCGKRQPIRIGSFFFRLQCSILQALQLILAWCEDADLCIATQYFDIKPKVATTMIDRLDEIAIRELKRTKLGGENAVVLAEMYPNCLNRQSPDTTDQPHAHRILMFADTKHIPTEYRFHVIKEDTRRIDFNDDIEFVTTQIEEARANFIEPYSTLVTGVNVPAVEGAASLQQLHQYCDADMQHFLSARIWRCAVSLCSASRELCAPQACGPQPCAALVQRYLDTALFRRRHASDDGFFERVLRLIAQDFACDEHFVYNATLLW